ncbi:MAG: polysaccharide ABC transporter ATP-binding protein [Ginsengibacter sp.]
MSDTIIKVENLSKQYRLGNVGLGSMSHDLNRWWSTVRGKEDPYLKIGEENDRTLKGSSEYVWALRDINFEVKKGEVLGIIGRNGAGKSTLLKILSRTTTPTMGSVRIKGRVASLLEVGTGFHPELSGRENIFLNGAILGMSKQEIKNKFDEIVDFAGVERYIDTPVKRYSSGMYVRLAFGVAAHLEPEILIVDEVLAVGDAEFQKKALGKIKDVSGKDGRTVLFVSHNMTAMKQLCDSCILMSNGRASEKGEVDPIVNDYLSMKNIFKISQQWPNGTGPGNAVAQVQGVEMHYSDGSMPPDGNFDITEEIGVTIKYTVLKEGYDFIHGANFFNNEDLNIFNSHDVSSDFRNKKRDKGDYMATMWIPGNLLSEGVFRMNIVLFKASPFEVFLSLEDIVCFNVVDHMKGNSARGNYTHGFPGAVRPLLVWDAKKIYK